jgi:hypothetical protein
MKKVVYLAMSCILTIAVWFAAAEICAQDEREDFAKQADVDKEKVDAAVKRGMDFLKGRQTPDGNWADEAPLPSLYPQGVTALCLYALLKGEEPNDSDCIKRGFDYLKKWWNSQANRTVYSTSCLILALCALYQPPPQEKEIEALEEAKPGEKVRTTAFQPYEKRLKEGFKKNAPSWAKDWLEDAVKWLRAQQEQNIWRYPGAQPGAKASAGPVEDASNTQYAMLALYTANSVGVNIPPGVFTKVAEYFINEQEKDGPDVKPFPVPAADFDIKQLKELEKGVLEEMRKMVEDQQKDAEEAKKRGEEPPKKEKVSTSAAEIPDPYKKFGVEPGKMKARGWGYVKKDAPLTGYPPSAAEDWCKVTGSMTTSGIASLVICKAEIEKSLSEKEKKALNQAIRDGVAWLAHNWTVTENPNCKCWKMYYLYGIERSGVLSLCNKIGEHKWYKEGAEHLFSTQQGDGSWPGDKERVPWLGRNGGDIGYGNICGTCFAILFLKRATVPIIKPPGQIYTGEGLLGTGRKPAPQPPEKGE